MTELTHIASSRCQQRDAWLKQVLGSAEFACAPASADASFRSYWRVQTADRTLVLMDAPPDKEDSRQFVVVCQQLRDGGLHAPEIITHDLSLGFLLLEDLGNTLFGHALNRESADRLYRDALIALETMQQLAIGQLPRYDAQFLSTELSLFPEWLLAHHLKVSTTEQFNCAWPTLTQLLIENALDQPTVFVHRDYHCRNLMVTNHNPGIIDFQDAVAGPITYDLVSLLRDCYVRWPAERVLGWSEQYRQQAVAAGLTTVDSATWQRWFDLMGVQRHLKAAAIFCRLNYRDGKPGYLADVPRTLSYVTGVCDRYEALKWFADFLKAEVVPLLEPAATLDPRHSDAANR